MTKINNLKWLQLIGVKYYLTKNTPSTTVKKAIAKKITKLSNDKTQVSVNNNIADSTRFAYEEPHTKSPNKHKAEIVTPEKLKLNNPNEQDKIFQARSLADQANSLDALKTTLQNFSGCELKKFATNLVFSDGQTNAKIMLIGEAPGKTEDMMGIPFCGESGILLDNLLKTIDISRHTNAYITNTVFWRPPANRTPSQEEIDICRPFVEKHIALINPKVIILVGSTAVISLFGKHSGLNNLRQQYHLYTNKYLSEPIITTSIFHPAYLLRQPMQKKTMWFDLLNIKHYLENNLNYLFK